MIGIILVSMSCFMQFASTCGVELSPDLQVVLAALADLREQVCITDECHADFNFVAGKDVALLFAEREVEFAIAEGVSEKQLAAARAREDAASHDLTKAVDEMFATYDLKK